MVLAWSFVACFFNLPDRKPPGVGRGRGRGEGGGGGRRQAKGGGIGGRGGSMDDGGGGGRGWSQGGGYPSGNRGWYQINLSNAFIQF